MGWVVALIVAVVVVAVWGVAGGILPATGSNGGFPTGSGCDACKNLKWWWMGLSLWQKFREWAFYHWKRMDCFMRGCPM
jgi:hypothetical protein